MSLRTSAWYLSIAAVLEDLKMNKENNMLPKHDKSFCYSCRQVTAIYI